jgi:hypothetical protein
VHNEDFHNLYCTPNVRVIKLWRMGWAGLGETRNACEILVANADGRR